MRVLVWLAGFMLAAGVAADILSVNDTLTPREQYRRLSLVLLIGEGVNEVLYQSLHSAYSPPQPQDEPVEQCGPFVQDGLHRGVHASTRPGSRARWRPGRRTGSATCESPGKASNSAMMPITGSPLPQLATNAVGMSATPAETSKPASASTRCRRRLLFSSR